MSKESTPPTLKLIATNSDIQKVIYKNSRIDKLDTCLLWKISPNFFNKLEADQLIKLLGFADYHKALGARVAGTAIGVDITGAGLAVTTGRTGEAIGVAGLVVVVIVSVVVMVVLPVTT